ncbi:hypothetical protein GCM10010358_11360 [Streptomyces minutiscleroticus]|uniref:Uncharacterized protein n=1 Tax=Streptomyces minutiscleroticus TaxID=68238 RepID=A0A918ND67_9ACTN|nr:hypothetical protein GCM10010358_11360 [Streptomyces minutiscleroticus]
MTTVGDFKTRSVVTPSRAGRQAEAGPSSGGEEGAVALPRAGRYDTAGTRGALVKAAARRLARRRGGPAAAVRGEPVAAPPTGTGPLRRAFRAPAPRLSQNKPCAPTSARPFAAARRETPMGGCDGGDGRV